jgi:hypothetical protein
MNLENQLLENFQFEELEKRFEFSTWGIDVGGIIAPPDPVLLEPSVGG